MKNWEQIDYRRFDKLDIIARQVVEGFIIGLHKSPYHGFSVEFAEYRSYNPGDSIRDVDWKAYAKTKKMYVKKHEEETNLRCQVIIDISSSMRYPETTSKVQLNKLEYSCVSAAALSYMLRKQRDAMGLTLVSDKIEVHTPAKTNAAHHQMIQNYLYQTLQNRSLNPLSTDLSVCLHQVAELIHKRSLVFVFSDFLEKPDQTEKIFSAIQHLRHYKNEVVVFHVHHKKDETDFEFENRPYQFIDLESGESVRLLPHEVKSFYREKISDHHKKVKSKFIQYGIDWVDADIQQDFKTILQTYLIKRRRMRV